MGGQPAGSFCFANRHGVGWRYFLFTDQTQDVELVGDGLFDDDGHCSLSPDGRWMLTDNYPDAQQRRSLLLYDLAGEIRHDLGHFHSIPDWPIPLPLRPAPALVAGRAADFLRLHPRAYPAGLHGRAGGADGVTRQRRSSSRPRRYSWRYWTGLAPQEALTINWAGTLRMCPGLLREGPS